MHHETGFIQDFYYEICKCGDTLAIRKSADKTNLNEVTCEEYETIYCPVSRYAETVQRRRTKDNQRRRKLKL